LLLAMMALLSLRLWRSALDLDGHVRAGAHVVAEVIATTARGPEQAAAEAAPEPIQSAFAGLGSPVAFELREGSAAVGRTLAELELRGQTGATVLAICRGPEQILPTGHETLERGDLLALAGTDDAVEAARQLLRPASSLSKD
jgi:CPA2 family monovalent cation:H+ antiporter-2